jgi:hypothetical protein
VSRKIVTDHCAVTRLARKRVTADDDTLDVELPHDREGTFDPVLITKGERGFTGGGAAELDYLGANVGITRTNDVWICRRNVFA